MCLCCRSVFLSLCLYRLLCFHHLQPSCSLLFFAASEPENVGEDINRKHKVSLGIAQIMGGSTHTWILAPFSSSVFLHKKGVYSSKWQCLELWTVLGCLYIFLSFPYPIFWRLKKMTNLPELLSWDGGWGDSGNANRKRFFYWNLLIFGAIESQR